MFQAHPRERSRTQEERLGPPRKGPQGSLNAPDGYVDFDVLVLPRGSNRIESPQPFRPSPARGWGAARVRPPPRPASRTVSRFAASFAEARGVMARWALRRQRQQQEQLQRQRSSGPVQGASGSADLAPGGRLEAHPAAAGTAAGAGTARRASGESKAELKPWLTRAAESERVWDLERESEKELEEARAARGSRVGGGAASGGPFEPDGMYSIEGADVLAQGDKVASASSSAISAFQGASGAVGGQGARCEREGRLDDDVEAPAVRPPLGSSLARVAEQQEAWQPQPPRVTRTAARWRRTLRNVERGQGRNPVDYEAAEDYEAVVEGPADRAAGRSARSGLCAAAAQDEEILVGAAGRAVRSALRALTAQDEEILAALQAARAAVDWQDQAVPLHVLESRYVQY